VSGALTERAFVEGLERAGFTDVVVRERLPFGLADLVGEPAIGSDLLDLMRRLLPLPVQRRVGVRLVISGRVRGDGGARA
jgi:hypothetical protein